MKNLARSLAIVLAVGAMIQTVCVYALENTIISLEEEEATIISLIEFKRRTDSYGESFQDASYELRNDFPNIKTEEDFKEAFAEHALRYLHAIGGEKSLKRVLGKEEYQRLTGDGPGI
jgi:hypothetical protein